ncbi:MAG TPA: hypothetical protein PKA10_18225 [Selenomonadales bacterium]|nr:hypothetical protein [Selenomonadales bacterium]
MPDTVHVSLDLPQNVYDGIVLLAQYQHKTIHQFIVDALEVSLAANRRDCSQPEYYPLGPSPWESNVER